MKNKKTNNLVQLVAVITIIILINIISSFSFFRLDLTADKRYTLSDKTKELMSSIDDIVYVKIFLDGEMPVGFQRMQKASKELLDEFRIYAKSNIHYEFINPSESDDEQQRNRLYQDLYNRGLDPTNVHEKDNEGGMSEKLLWPGAIITFQGKEVAVNLLKNIPTFSSEVNLNNSIQTLEYEFARNIQKLVKAERQKIAIIEGHNELNEFEMEDITHNLAQFYRVDRVTLLGDDTLLNNYSVVIVANPQSQWNEQDKYVLDQYIMHGGKVLWFLDALNMSMDSLSSSGSTMAFLRETNLDDQLFRYGVRINPNIIQDVNCAVIPINTAPAGKQPKFAPAPWLYHPLLIPPQNNPITKDINMVKSQFASVIDTLQTKIKSRKSILLASSTNSRTLNAPLLINMDEVAKRLNPQQFNKSFLPVAVLMEGQFESCFKNRMIQNFRDANSKEFKEVSEETKMLVISDGDLPRNDVFYKPGGYAINPLGYDRYSKQTFGNKDFILNAVHYLADESGLLELRSREITLRLLDKQKIAKERMKWQILNILLPILTVVCFGILFNYLRKKKYSTIK